MIILFFPSCLSSDFNIENKGLQELLNINRQRWDDFGEKLIGVLSKYYPELSTERYKSHKKNRACGRFKFNSYITSEGLDGRDDNMMRLYMKYKEDMAGIYGQSPFPFLEEVIGIFHSAKGKVIVPGGYLRNPGTFDEDLESLRGLGVDGFEVYSPSYDDKQSERVRRFALKSAESFLMEWKTYLILYQGKEIKKLVIIFFKIINSFM